MPSGGLYSKVYISPSRRRLCQEALTVERRGGVSLAHQYHLRLAVLFAPFTERRSSTAITHLGKERALDPCGNARKRPMRSRHCAREHQKLYAKSIPVHMRVYYGESRFDSRVDMQKPLRAKGGIDTSNDSLEGYRKQNAMAHEVTEQKQVLS